MDVEAERRRLAASFDAAAQLYDEARPRYPAALVERILETSGIPAEGRILEIGAGPGNATLAFAERGFTMTCLEPGPALAARLRENVRAYPRVRTLVTRFEDWPLETGYDLVISGQAFHWVDPAVAYQKCADALRPGGFAACFWNRPAPASNPELEREIRRAYAKHAPALLSEGGSSLTRHGPPEDRFADSGRFREVQREEFPWIARYTTQHYQKLERTHSDHLVLPPAVLDRLVEAVGEAIERHGGVYDVPQVCWLYLAERLA
jgi:SAM-dependent methyltransferase